MASLLAGQSAQAVNYSYIGTGDSNWNVPASYTTVTAGTPATASPVAGDNVLFNYTGNNHNENIYLNGAEAAASLTFFNTGTTTLLGGVAGTPAANTLTLTAGMTVGAGAGAVTIGDTSAPAGTARVTLTVSGNQSFTNNSANTLTIANNLATGTAASVVTLNGTGNFSLLGGLTPGTGILSLTKLGQGTLTMTGTVASTYQGATTLGGGTVNLDYSQGVQRLSTGILTLNGTNLNLSGGNFTQTVASTTLNAGSTTIARTNGGASTIALGNLTGTAAGGALNFAAVGVATTTSATSATTGILGARYTVGTTGAADWATGAATAGTATAVGAYTNYTTTPITVAASSNTNYLVTGPAALTAPTTATTYAANTLKIANSTTATGPEALTLDPLATLAISGNGLLYVGAQGYNITGGTLRANTANELVISQYGAGNLTIGSTITGTGALTKTGPGTLTLTGANAYTGATYIDAGTLAVSGTTTTPFGTGGALFLGDAGTLNLAGAGATPTIASLNNVYTNAGGNVVLGANTLTLSATTGTLSFGGVISGTGGLTKTGASVQNLTGLSTYTGVTTLSAGTVNVTNLGNGGQASGIGASTAAANNLVLDGGTLGYNGTTSASTDRLFTLGASGAIDASSTGQNTLTFSNTAAIGFTGGSAHILTLTGTNTGSSNVSTNSSLASNSTFASQIIDDTAGGATSLVKNGTGTWVLTNTGNTYSGGTTISQGRLVVTSPNNIGAGSVTVNTTGQLVLAGGTYNNALSIQGIGPTTQQGTVSGAFGALVLNNGAVQAGTVTLNGNARVSGTSTFTGLTTGGTISGQITGTGGLEFSAGGNPFGGVVTVSNPLNNYTGDTTISVGTTSGGNTITLLLGASNVIPNGANAGNVVMGSTSQAGNPILTLNGFNETINGLASSGDGNPGRLVQNGSTTASLSTLTLGDNNASANYLGTLNNGASGTLAINKIGTGTQTLSGASAAGVSNYTGGTTVSAGTLQLDFNQYTSTQSLTPTNYLAAAGAATLNGGTFAVAGRANGQAQTATVISTTGRSQGAVLASVDGIVPGQTVTVAGLNYYVVFVDQATRVVYINSADKLASGTVMTFAATTGAASSQTLAGVTLGGGSSGVVINDNGSGATVLNMGGLTRNVLGATVDFVVPTAAPSATEGALTTTTDNTNGVLTTATGTAYATVGGAAWASNTSVVGAGRGITAVAGINDSYTATDNTNVTTNSTQSGATVNTLRFATGGTTLDLTGGASTVGAGGILVTAATAGNAVNITSTDGAGGLAPGAGSELVIVNNGALNVGAQIFDGAAGVTNLSISGYGTTTFTGANSFQGTTTLNGGVYTPGNATRPIQTVYVNGQTYVNSSPVLSDSGLGNGPLVVNNNVVLAGNGVVNTRPTGGDVTINGGASVSPGTAPGMVGTLSLVTSTVTFAGSTLNGLATLTLDVAGTQSDLLRIVGNLDLGGSLDQLVVSGTTDPATSSYTLVTYTGTRTGTFDAVSLPTGYSLNYVDPAAGALGRIDLVTTVPEPGTWAALAVGGAALAATHRRRRQRRLAKAV